MILLGSSCSNSKPETQLTLSSTEDGSYQASVRPNLQWKRYAAFESDLVRGLELEPDALCNEFGKESCIRHVHLVPLGGHDPFASGLLVPSAETLATTPAAVDRVLLSACSKRAQLDKKAGRAEAKVFDQLSLDGEAPPPDSVEARNTVISLYRRLLGRDPDAHEVPLVAALTRDEDGEPRSASDFATLSCFSIGTSTEFLFF